MKYMKYSWITPLIILFLTATATAQSGDFTSKADSDPKAKAILDKLRKKYEVEYRDWETS